MSSNWPPQGNPPPNWPPQGNPPPNWPPQGNPPPNWPPQGNPPPNWPPQGNPPPQGAPPQGGWTPQGYPPSGMAPPGYTPQPPQKSSAGCWIWGLGGCALIIIVTIAVIAMMVAGVKASLRSPASHGVGYGFNGALQIGRDTAFSKSQMTNIGKGLASYRADHGNYPSDLNALVPTYVPTQADMHSPLDADTNPYHITYTYIPPYSNAPGSTPVLVVHGTYSMVIGQQTQTTVLTTTMALDGSFQQSRTESQTMN